MSEAKRKEGEENEEGEEERVECGGRRRGERRTKREKR